MKRAEQDDSKKVGIVEAAVVTATEDNFVSGVDTGTYTDAGKTSMLTHITNRTEPAETLTDKSLTKLRMILTLIETLNIDCWNFKS